MVVGEKEKMIVQHTGARVKGKMKIGCRFDEDEVLPAQLSAKPDERTTLRPLLSFWAYT
jgi:hypothetical protein